MINNKKILIGIIFAVFAVLLTSCKASDALSVDVKEYFAKKDNGFDIIYDYDAVVSICNDACQEFARAVGENNKSDFTPYINNENFQIYMQYRVDNHIFSYNKDTIYKLMITEVSFNDDYVLVGGITGTREEPDASSLQGMNYFLIKNVNGRLYIADWYWDNMDSPDVEYRGEFSCEDNLTYWDEPEKYNSILDKIGSI